MTLFIIITTVILSLLGTLLIYKNFKNKPQNKVIIEPSKLMDYDINIYVTKALLFELSERTKKNGTRISVEAVALLEKGLKWEAKERKDLDMEIEQRR